MFVSCSGAPEAGGRTHCRFCPAIFLKRVATEKRAPREDRKIKSISYLYNYVMSSKIKLNKVCRASISTRGLQTFFERATYSNGNLTRKQSFEKGIFVETTVSTNVNFSVLKKIFTKKFSKAKILIFYLSQHSRVVRALGSKPRHSVVSLGKIFYDTIFSAWQSWQAVLIFSHIFLN